jgi:hypothetical protein
VEGSREDTGARHGHQRRKRAKGIPTTLWSLTTGTYRAGKRGYAAEPPAMPNLLTFLLQESQAWVKDWRGRQTRQARVLRRTLSPD